MKIKNVNKKLEDNTFIVTKEIEEVLNETELLARKQSLMHQISGLKNQMLQIKNQYNNLISDVADIDNMLQQLSDNTNIIMTVEE